jgi:hypothetical protein
MAGESDLPPRRTELTWPALASWADPEPGATEEQIQQLLDSISEPLTEEKIRLLEERLGVNPYPPSDPAHATYMPIDARALRMPARRLPDSFLDFLRWSNGGRFRHGNRELEFFGCEGVRNMRFNTCLVAFAPLVVPFGWHDGNMLGFDTGKDPGNGEFPVVFVHQEMMRYPFEVASGFVEFCRGMTDPAEIFWKDFGRRHGVAEEQPEAAAPPPAPIPATASGRHLMEGVSRVPGEFDLLPRLKQVLPTTASEWDLCVHPQLLLDAVRGKASSRQLRLFATSCARRIMPLLQADQLPDPASVVEVQRTLETVERFLDDRLTSDELAAANLGAFDPGVHFPACAVASALEACRGEGAAVEGEAANASACALEAWPEEAWLRFQQAHTAAKPSQAEIDRRDEEIDCRQAAAMLAQAAALRDIIGNPFARE